MLSCVAVSGKVHRTAYQYDFFVRSMKTANEYFKMRQYRSVTSAFWRKMVAYAFPTSRVKFIKEIPRMKNGRKIKTAADGSKHPGDCVRIMLPSQWAILDVSNDIFFRNVFERVDASNPGTFSIENSPIVQHRRTVNASDLSV